MNLNIQLPNPNAWQNVYFADDVCEVICKTETDDTRYIKVTANMIVFPYDYYGAVYGLSSAVSAMFHRQAVVKFNTHKGVARFNVGDIVKPYFYIPRILREVIDLTFVTINPLKSPFVVALYAPMQVVLTIEECDLLSDEVISSLTSNKMEFIAGRFRNSQLINMQSYNDRKTVSRLTENSMVSCACMYDADGGALQIWENDTLYYAFSMSPGLMPDGVTEYLPIFGMIFKQAAGTWKVGDRVSFQYADYAGIDRRIVYPKGLQSCHVLWLDENLCLRIFEMSGKITKKDSHDYVSASFMKKYKLAVRTLEDSAEEIYTLNTGFITKDDVEQINSLLKSKKCWITFDGFRRFRSFENRTKELTVDSEQQLYYADIEIRVNDDWEDHAADSEADNNPPDTELHTCTIPVITSVINNNDGTATVAWTDDGEVVGRTSEIQYSPIDDVEFEVDWISAGIFAAGQSPQTIEVSGNTGGTMYFRVINDGAGCNHAVSALYSVYPWFNGTYLPTQPYRYQGIWNSNTGYTQCYVKYMNNLGEAKFIYFNSACTLFYAHKILTEYNVQGCTSSPSIFSANCVPANPAYTDPTNAANVGGTSICITGNQFTQNVSLLSGITIGVGAQLCLQGSTILAIPANLAPWGAAFKSYGIRWMRHNATGIIWDVNPQTGIIIGQSSFSCPV
jgi:hypothetical protein